MTRLMLIKGYEWDGVNVFPAVVGTPLMNIMNQAPYKKSIDFIRIGDPILIDLTHVEALEYCYGCIVSDNTTFFITVTSIEVAKSTAVYLHYTIDWFTTLRHAQRISFGRCHIIKSSDVNPDFYEQNVQPSDMRVTDVKGLNEDFYTVTTNASGDNVEFITNPWLVMAAIVDGKSKYFYSPFNKYGVRGLGGGSLGLKSTISLSDVYSGEFTSLLGISPQDVTGVWVSPIRPTSPMNKETAESKVWYEDAGLTSMGGYGSYIKHVMTIDEPIKSTPMSQFFITDNLGNPLYQIPIGREIDKIEFKTTTTFSSHLTHVKIFDVGHEEKNENFENKRFNMSKKMENSYFTISSPLVDYVNDTYKNWSTGLKEVEAEERRIQRNKNLAQGIGGSVLTGALGATAGPAGAAMGVAGGLGGALLSYGVDTYYETQTAELEDRKYQAMPDTLIPGSYTVDEEVPPLLLVKLSARPEDISRYNAEIKEYGANCNLPLSSWTPKKGVYKFADVEVKGDFPYDIKQNIRMKLQQGIRLI